MVICPKCGHQNKDTARNCVNCRINLEWALENVELFEKAQPTSKRINLLLVLVCAAIVVLIVVGLRSCVGGIASFFPVKPKVGDTVRVVCKRPEWATGRLIEQGSDGQFLIVLLEQVDPMGQRAGTIPCETIVTIEDIHEWRGRDYFVVPVDSELPSGWLSSLTVEDHIEFEKCE